MESIRRSFDVYPMSPNVQSWRPQADAADLKEFWDLLRRHTHRQHDTGTLHTKSLLARLALRGMIEQGASEQEIADALGITPERVRLLRQQCFDGSNPNATSE